MVPGAMLPPSGGPVGPEDGVCGEGGHSGRDLPQRGLHPFKGVHHRGKG